MSVKTWIMSDLVMLNSAKGLRNLAGVLSEWMGGRVRYFAIYGTAGEIIPRTLNGLIRVLYHEDFIRFLSHFFFCSKPPAVLYTPWKWIYAEAPSSFSNSNPFLQYMADPPPIKMRVFCMRFSGLFGVSLKKSGNRVVTFSLSIIKSNFSKYYTIAIVTKFLVNRSVLNPVNVLSQFLNLRKIQSLLQPPSHNSSMRLRLIFLFKMLYQALTCNFSFQINLEAF